MGPLTEEWVFRSCMVPVLLCAGYSQLKVMLLCPLFFGLAHSNHYWETVSHEKPYHGVAALITVEWQIEEQASQSRIRKVGQANNEEQYMEITETGTSMA